VLRSPSFTSPSRTVGRSANTQSRSPPTARWSARRAFKCVDRDRTPQSALQLRGRLGGDRGFEGIEDSKGDRGFERANCPAPLPAPRPGASTSPPPFRNEARGAREGGKTPRWGGAPREALRPGAGTREVLELPIVHLGKKHLVDVVMLL